MQTKVCTKCCKEKLLNAFGKNAKGKNGLNSWCRNCCLEYGRWYRSTEHGKTKRSIYGKEYQQRPKAKEIQKKWNNSEEGHIAKEKWLKQAKTKWRFTNIDGIRRYIARKEYEKLWLSQGGKCAVCGRTEPQLKRQFNIDHDHMTGKIRGLLCGNCNTGIGLLKHNPQLLLKAIWYLKHDTKTETNCQNIAV